MNTAKAIVQKERVENSLDDEMMGPIYIDDFIKVNQIKVNQNNTKTLSNLLDDEMLGPIYINSIKK